MVKSLGGFPGLAVGLCFALLIAPGHVDTQGIAIYVIKGVFHGDVLAAFADGDNKFNFVMHI